MWNQTPPATMLSGPISASGRVSNKTIDCATRMSPGRQLCLLTPFKSMLTIDWELDVSCISKTLAALFTLHSVDGKFASYDRRVNKTMFSSSVQQYCCPWFS